MRQQNDVIKPKDVIASNTIDTIRSSWVRRRTIRYDHHHKSVHHLLGVAAAGGDGERLRLAFCEAGDFESESVFRCRGHSLPFG
ncbi:hypothetical protein PoB_006751100 [Plakobranchus ocellatus]|uniref:Uncharacterized protein n=1 Tax=Plakobranchus ocellatus TaxID=259542 RepID=A0AAV4DA06_9GAST|nr:hypothetical protein PoB_006751100 [Plakobranchus ocellatus]